MVHELSRQDARRIAIRAQRLDKQRPRDLHETVHDLSLLQLEPTKAIAPSADLVVWSRLGSSYDADELRDAINGQSLIELRGTVRVPEDLPLYFADMAEWPGPLSSTGERTYRHGLDDWVRDNNACRLDILQRLRSDGPLPLKELPDTCVRPWKSSGWNNNRNVTMLLDLLVQKGEVAVAGYDERGRLWDLAERIYPDDLGIPADEARRRRDRRRLSALGVAKSKGPACPVEPLDAGDAGEPARIEGVRGQWRVDPAQLGQPFEGRAALLSPFDRLLHDRKRMGDLFEFDYIVEMYKPAEQRQWGYYALPILYGDRLVGKLDAKAERAEGVLRVNAIHQDVQFTKAMTAAIDRELEDLATWLDLELDLPG